MVKTFREFEFDDRRRRLTKAGRPVRLPSQSVELLSLLIERPGQLIAREEIKRRLWPDSHVEFDHSLDVVVSRLRSALGDGATGPGCIATVPRKGYRFVEPITVRTDVAVRTRGRVHWARRFGAYVTVAILAAVAAILISRTRYQKFVRPPRTTTLTTPAR